MKRNVQIALPCLFLTAADAVEAVGGLRLPALESLLARGEHAPLSTPDLEQWLCKVFGSGQGGVAAVTLLADGGDPVQDYWMRADPMHLTLSGSEVQMRRVDTVGSEEAAFLLADLNRHFAGSGLEFVMLKPDRWYVRLLEVPDLSTWPPEEVFGLDIRHFQPQGKDALRCHSWLNEIQMLLSAHPVNLARESCGDLAINSVWLWGGGVAPASWARPSTGMVTDCELAACFGKASGIPVRFATGERLKWDVREGYDLVVWEGLRHALRRGDAVAWRDSLKMLHEGVIEPAWRALRMGKIDSIALHVMREGGGVTITATSRGAWRLWRRGQRLTRALTMESAT